jgi:hypothetical protein
MIWSDFTLSRWKNAAALFHSGWEPKFSLSIMIEQAVAAKRSFRMEDGSRA